MELLESAMAFAVVMIVLSTIATGLVEALLRFIRLRQDALVNMLETFLKKEALPRLEEALKEGDSKLAEKAGAMTKAVGDKDLKDLVGKLMENPLEAASKGMFANWFRRVDELTPYSFMQRLAKHELGRGLAAKAGDGLADIVTDISRTYERYQAASREYFRKRAHIVSFIVAILLALALNVDGLRVMLHLMDHPDARVALIEQGEESITANREALERIEKLQAGGDLDEDDAAALKQSLKTVGAEIDQLRATGDLPIGPERWPLCLGETLPPECAEDDPKTKEVEGWGPVLSCDGLLWLAKVLVTGVLIGLGGPFWYKVFMSLSQVAQSARSLRGNRELVTEPQGAGAQPGAQQDPEKLAEMFKVAAGKAD